MSSPSSPRISSDSLSYWPARLKPPYAMRQGSFQAACIAASMEQRSRCTLNGAVPKTTKRCARIRRRCRIFSRRWQSQNSIPECTKSSRPTLGPRQSPNLSDSVSASLAVPEVSDEPPPFDLTIPNPFQKHRRRTIHQMSRVQNHVCAAARRRRQVLIQRLLRLSSDRARMMGRNS